MVWFKFFIYLFSLSFLFWHYLIDYIFFFVFYQSKSLFTSVGPKIGWYIFFCFVFYWRNTERSLNGGGGESRWSLTGVTLTTSPGLGDHVLVVVVDDDDDFFFFF